MVYIQGEYAFPGDLVVFSMLGQDITNQVDLVKLNDTLVELTGQRSNEFEEDLSSAIKHLDVID